MFIERWIFDMNSINKNTKKGFTIIEVVLVLAIAGLIFLMVFLALPALQRSQRDTQRKNDASRLRAAITDYSSNNRGKLPFNAQHGGSGNLEDRFISNYVLAEKNGQKGTGSSTFNDPSTNTDYNVVVGRGNGNEMSNAPLGTMRVASASKCDSDGRIAEGNSIVVSVKTENGVANCVEG